MRSLLFIVNLAEHRLHVGSLMRRAQYLFVVWTQVVAIHISIVFARCLQCSRLDEGLGSDHRVHGRLMLIRRHASMTERVLLRSLQKQLIDGHRVGICHILTQALRVLIVRRVGRGAAVHLSRLQLLEDHVLATAGITHGAATVRDRSIAVLLGTLILTIAMQITALRVLIMVLIR